MHITIDHVLLVFKLYSNHKYVVFNYNLLIIWIQLPERKNIKVSIFSSNEYSYLYKVDFYSFILVSNEKKSIDN